MLSNLPNQRIKGPRTKHGGRNARRSHKIPTSFSARNVETIQTQWDCPGYVEVKDADTELVAREVLSAYHPLVVKSVGTTPGAAGEVDTAYWNDGILTGIFSHYSQFPMETANPRFPNRPGVSNMMVNGRSLWGGGIIGYSWNRLVERFAMNAAVTGTYAQTFNAPIRNILDTRFLSFISYAVKLEEQTWYRNNLFDENATFSNTLGITPFLDTTSTSTVSGMQGAFATQNNTAMNIMNWLPGVMNLARVKIRNLIIRLPAQPVNMGSEATGGEWRGNMDHLFDSTTDWQTTLWNLIKQDLMLIGNNTYGPPTGFSSDLKARINPKYTVIRDFSTIMGGSNPMGASGAPRVKKSQFYHRFRTDKPVRHLGSKADHKFSDGSSNTKAAVEYGTAQSTAQDIGDVEEVSYTAQANKRRKQDGGVPTNDQAEGPTLDLSEEMEGEAVQTGVFDGAASSETTPSVLTPESNRIIWIRIPRLATRGVELDDLKLGKKQFLPGFSVGDDPALSSHITLLALAQMCSTVKGSTTFKYLDPSVIGTGSSVGPNGYSSTETTWGPIDAQMEQE